MISSTTAVIPDQVWFLGQATAQGSRDAMAQFWLAAPKDQLEPLWKSHFGTVTAELIRQLTPNFTFTDKQVSLREQINRTLQQGGLQQPLGPQLLIAVFLFSPPGLMEVANPDQNMPGWLAQAYRDIYNKQIAPAAISQTNIDSNQFEAPEFGAFPSSLQDLVGNRIHLNRILGLSNLYYIDPEDQEITTELTEVRAQLADLIVSAPESSLESIWTGDFGDRYWAMVRSGIQAEPRQLGDEQRLQAAVQRLNPNQGGGFGTPGALNAILVAMLYFKPGTMQVADAERQLPAWLLDNYKQIFQIEPAQAHNA